MAKQELLPAVREKTFLEIPLDDRKSLMQFAEAAVRSGFGGNHDSKESAYCALIYGLEVGLSPNQSLQSVYTVPGKGGKRKAAMEVEAKAALVVAWGAPPPKKWIENEEFFGTDRQDQVRAYCEVVRVWNDKPITYRCSFSLGEAREAGLLGKDNWRGYWRDMLKWRAEDRAIDDAYPDIIKGLAGAENLDPYEPERPPLPAPMTVKEEAPWASDVSEQGKVEDITSPSPEKPADVDRSSSPPDVSTAENGSSGSQTAEGGLRQTTLPGLPSPKKSEPQTAKELRDQKAAATQSTLPSTEQEALTASTSPTPSETTSPKRSEETDSEPPWTGGSQTTTKPSSKPSGLPGLNSEGPTGSVPNENSPTPRESSTSNSALPTPEKPSETARKTALMENEKDWKIWCCLSPHLPGPAFADVKKRVGGQVFATMKQSLLRQAITRAKFHLGPMANQLLKNLGE